jgi:hypothetical protein
MGSPSFVFPNLKLPCALLLFPVAAMAAPPDAAGSLHAAPFERPRGMPMLVCHGDKDDEVR